VLAHALSRGHITKPKPTPPQDDRRP
jgi:hypothetical protein